MWYTILALKGEGPNIHKEGNSRIPLNMRTETIHCCTEGTQLLRSACQLFLANFGGAKFTTDLRFSLSRQVFSCRVPVFEKKKKKKTQ